MSGLTAVLSAAKALHAATPGMQGFAPWKGIDPMDQNRPARVLPALDLVKGFDLSGTSATQPLIDAICASADLGHWIQTYTEAEVGRHFLDNYGYYELIGPRGISSRIRWRAMWSICRRAALPLAPAPG